MNKKTVILPDFIQSNDDLFLRAVAIADTDKFLKILIENQNHFSHFDFVAPTFKTHLEVANVIQSLVHFQNDARGVSYGLWKKDELIGLFTINRIDWEKKIADIGFWLIETAVGKGYAIQALNSMVNCCWQELGLKRLTAHTATTNSRSQKLLGMAGFRHMAIL